MPSAAERTGASAGPWRRRTTPSTRLPARTARSARSYGSSAACWNSASSSTPPTLRPCARATARNGTSPSPSCSPSRARWRNSRTRNEVSVTGEEAARAGVRDALEGCLKRGEVGVQVAVYRGGDLILDESIGVLAEGSSREVDSGTLFPIFSVTKILPIMAIHLQAERGLLGYDAPVASYWPQYAANGKAPITIGHVLAHRAGVPNMPDGVTIDNIGDWDWMTGRLAELAPVWPTNTRSSYLSYTYGWILGEVVRRTDPLHRSFQQFLIDELFAPLGIVDLYLGIPDDDAVEDRIATLTAPSFKPASDQAAPFRRLAIPPGLAPGAVFNDPRLRRAVFPSAAAITNARSVARLMAVIANRGELDGVR